MGWLIPFLIMLLTMVTALIQYLTAIGLVN